MDGTLQNTQATSRPDDPWLTAAEAAAHLQVCVRTLKTWVAERTVPHVRLPGRVLRFDREALDVWARERSVAPVPDVRTRSTQMPSTNTVPKNRYTKMWS